MSLSTGLRRLRPVRRPVRPGAPRVPLLLRRRPVRRTALGPRDPRWWWGVSLFFVSSLLLGFVLHVTVVGALQHERAQFTLQQQLRTDLATAVSPLGQLDVDGVLVETGEPIALLSIPRIGVSEVVVQGTTSSALTSGPGHRRDTVYPGQEGLSVLMGRQATYGGPFARLGELEPGDAITVVTGQGEHRYEVFDVRRDGDPVPEVAPSVEGVLRLVSASGLPLAPDRLIYVDAALTSDVQETPSPVMTKEVLGAEEWPMAVDPSGVFAATIWLQWLVVASVLVLWARSRWGAVQTWMVAVPLLLALGAGAAHAVFVTFANLL